MRRSPLHGGGLPIAEDLPDPKDSKGEGDYIDVLQVLSGEQANIPLKDSLCPYVKV